MGATECLWDRARGTEPMGWSPWDRAHGTELYLGVPHALWKEETQRLPVSAPFSPDQLEALQILTQSFR